MIPANRSAVARRPLHQLGPLPQRLQHAREHPPHRVDTGHRQPEVHLAEPSGGGADEGHRDHPLADQLGVRVGQGHHGHAAHGVPGQHDRALGDGRVDHGLQVAAQLVDGDRPVLPRLRHAPPGPAVAALVPVHGAYDAPQGRPLEVPGVLVEAVAVAEDDGDGGGRLASEQPPPAPGERGLRLRVDVVDLVVQLGAVVGVRPAGGAAQSAVRPRRVEGEPGLLAHAPAHGQPLYRHTGRGTRRDHAYRDAGDAGRPAPAARGGLGGGLRGGGDGRRDGLRVALAHVHRSSSPDPPGCRADTRSSSIHWARVPGARRAVCRPSHPVTRSLVTRHSFT